MSGSFKDGVLDGAAGKKSWPDGMRYEGDFSNGSLTGK